LPGQAISPVIVRQRSHLPVKVRHAVETTGKVCRNAVVPDGVEGNDPGSAGIAKVLRETLVSRLRLS
jgi:hypothetical protein